MGDRARAPWIVLRPLSAANRIRPLRPKQLDQFRSKTVRWPEVRFGLRRLGDVRVASAFHLIADVRQSGRHVRKVPIGDKRNERGRQLSQPPACSRRERSVLETLIAAPPPGIARFRTIFRYHFGAFDVVMGNRLCTLNRRHSGPCRGRAVAGRAGESNAAVYRCITRGCNRWPRGLGAAGNRPRPRFLWSGYLLRRFDHDVRKRGGGAPRRCCRLRHSCAA
jgi:hypothetical protein